MRAERWVWVGFWWVLEQEERSFPPRTKSWMLESSDVTLGEPGMWVAPGLDPEITAGWVIDRLEDGLYLDRT